MTISDLSSLKVDPARLSDEFATGILVRAQHDGRWINADIGSLDKASLLTWLRSRGGENPWAENTVGILLGHDNLVDGDRP